MKKLNYLLDYFKFLKNPIIALMFKFGLKKECEIKLKNSPTTVKLTSVFSLNRLMNAIPYTNVEEYEKLKKKMDLKLTLIQLLSPNKVLKKLE